MDEDMNVGLLEKVREEATGIHDGLDSVSLAVRGRRPAGHVGYKDEPAVKVELEKDAPVANATTGSIRCAAEAHSVAGERVSGEPIELEQ
jgi:hypothetical protein